MRILIGYILLIFSIIIFFSLISFNPNDSYLLISQLNLPINNLLGTLGANISSILVIIYGIPGSYILNFGFFVISLNILSGQKVGRILIKVLFFLISAISMSTITSYFYTDNHNLISGISGLCIYKTFEEILPSYLILWIFILIFILTLISTLKIFRILFKKIFSLFKLVFLFPLSTILSTNNNKTINDNTIFTKNNDNLKNNDGNIEEFKDINYYDDNFNNENSIEEINSSFDRNIPKPEFISSNIITHNKNQEDNNEFVINYYKEPSWLRNNKEKQEIINQIENIFKIDNDNIKKQKELREKNEIINLEVFSKKEENDLDFNNDSNKNEKNNIIDNEKIDEVDYDEEIVGEADYKEEVEHRETSNKEKLNIIDSNNISSLYNNNYIFPKTDILELSNELYSKNEELMEIEKTIKIIEEAFESFKIQIKVSGYSRGPSITRYEIIPPPGLKIKSVVNLTDDLALKLGNKNIRIVAPIGNKSIIGIEVPNKYRKSVVLREILESEEFKKSKAKLPLILGKDIAGNIVIEDLTEMPHLLIAGTTGSGKSVYVNALIGGLIFTKTHYEVKFIFIDPKMVELELYNGIPHLLAPVITEPEESIVVLEWVSDEMDRRYKVLSEYGVRNIVEFNNLVYNNNLMETITPYPYIVIIIDEFANLMLRLPKETERIISRIAAMARAVGIHLVVATQRPSVDVVTGIIKANFPSRIAFRVSSQTDSRTIMDKIGAEKLLGKGDMLFMTPNFTDLLRIQSPYTSNKDVESIVEELKKNGGPDYQIDIEELMSKNNNVEEGSEIITDYKEDPVFIDCLKAAVENGEVSASFLQRKFRIGYNRASRIMETFEKMKILGPPKGAGKPREVLVNYEDIQKYL